MKRLLWSVARSVTLTLASAALVAGLAFPCSTAVIAADVLAEFQDPPREFSVMPFWFWNDDLQDEEIVRQIADFEAHGVYGFVIHPRIGLPRDIGWLSPRMIQAMHVAVDEAVRRRMYVVLYDEGMYPSGSSAGQVVARNPDHAARGLAKIDLQPGEHPQLEDGWKLVATLERSSGRRLAVVERPTSGVIRGLHYLGEDTRVEPDGVHLAGLHYRAVILDGALHVPANALPALQQLASHQRLIILGRSPYAAQLSGARAVATPTELLAAIDALVKPDLTLTPASTNLRYRHVVKGGRHFYLLFNEEESPVTAQVDLSVRGRREWLDPFTAAATPAPSEEAVVFQPHQFKVLTAAVLNPSE